MTLKVLYVDHTGLPGGGQLGLARYMSLPSVHDRRVLFLSGGPVCDSLTAQHLASSLPTRRESRVKRIAGFRMRLRKEIESHAPDLVVANSLKAAVAIALARPRNTLLVYYIRQDMTVASMGLARSVGANALVFPRFDGFIANSVWTSGTVPRTLRRRPLEIAYPVSGVEEILSATANRAPTASPKIRLLALGRLAAWKGTDVVISALRLLVARGYADRFTLTIAGGTHFEKPEYRARLTRTAQLLGAPVTFRGHVDDVAGLLRDHDVLVHTSRRPEPFGQVLVQGMAAGLVVVATARGGPMEIIHDGVDGLLVRPGNPYLLADALERVARDSELRERIRLQAPKSAISRFGDAAVTEAFDAAQVSVVSAARRRKRFAA